MDEEAEAEVIVGPHRIRIVQSVDGPFRGTGADESGCVLWGASVALARYVEEEVRGGRLSGRFVEVGCGLGLPCVAAALAGAASVTATDANQTTVDRCARIAQKCGAHLTTQVLDWDEFDAVPRGDVVLGADVVYGRDVEPLVVVIDKIAVDGAAVVIAAREGRLGVSEFKDAMLKRFDLVDSTHVTLTQEPWATTPDRAAGDIVVNRFVKTPIKDRLNAKRSELNQCKKEMLRLQTDLKDLALTFQDDINSLLAALGDGSLTAES